MPGRFKGTSRQNKEKAQPFGRALACRGSGVDYLPAASVPVVLSVFSVDGLAAVLALW